MIRTFLVASAGLFAAAIAHAGQPATANPEPDPSDSKMTAPAQPPDHADDEAAAAAFSESQIDAYARATIEMEALFAEPDLDEATRQQRAAGIVTASGIDTSTFSAISTAVRNDPALAQRVQQAITDQRSATRG